MLEHGGNIAVAANQYGIAESDWLDLSTGINPQGWPVPKIPTEVWQRLPDQQHGVIEHACQYYGCRDALVSPGSQAAIQILPRLRSKCKVGIISPTYAEHAQAWQHHGHDVQLISSDKVEVALPQLDVLVVVSPNNPTGQRYTQAKLFSWHQQLQQKDGWLIIDEAFMDAEPENSLASQSHQQGLIILRSLGKFFGLAGLRCGFVLAEQKLLQKIQQQLGPWPVNGPALYIAAKALQDSDWQLQTRQRLKQDAKRLIALLAGYDLVVDGDTALFQWLQHDDALMIHESLAAKGILTRYFLADVTGSPSLRFGLPGNEQQWQQLDNALSSITLPLAKVC